MGRKGKRTVDDRAQKKKGPRKRYEMGNGEIRFFADDVTIVHCNAPNVESSRCISESMFERGEGNKNDYCLTSKQAEIKLQNATHLISLCISLLVPFTDVCLSD